MPDECSAARCNMLQYFTGSQTKNGCIAASICFTVMLLWKSCRGKFTKIVDLSGVSIYHVTSFECLRHVNLSLRQRTTCLSMTSKSCSLSYFEHSSDWYFSVYSLWRYIINSNGKRRIQWKAVKNKLYRSNASNVLCISLQLVNISPVQTLETGEFFAPSGLGIYSFVFVRGSWFRVS